MDAREYAERQDLIRRLLGSPEMAAAIAAYHNDEIKLFAFVLIEIIFKIA